MIIKLESDIFSGDTMLLLFIIAYYGQASARLSPKLRKNEKTTTGTRIHGEKEKRSCSLAAASCSLKINNNFILADADVLCTTKPYVPRTQNPVRRHVRMQRGAQFASGWH